MAVSKRIVAIMLAMLFVLPSLFAFSAEVFATDDDNLPKPGEPILSMDGSLLKWVQTPHPQADVITKFTIRVNGDIKATVDAHVKQYDLKDLKLDPKDGPFIIIVTAVFEPLGTDGQPAVPFYVESKQSIYDPARDPNYVVPPIGTVPTPGPVTPPIGTVPTPGPVTPPIGTVPTPAPITPPIGTVPPSTVTPPIGTIPPQLPAAPSGPMVLTEAMRNLRTNITNALINQPMFFETNVKDDQYEVGYISLRYFAENFLGITPSWDSTNFKATLQANHRDTGELITLTIVSRDTNATVNNRTADIAGDFLHGASGPRASISAMIRYDAMYLPFRFVAEIFGYDVSYDDGSVIIQ